MWEPTPAANPNNPTNNYTNTFWAFAPDSPALPSAVTDLSSVDAIGWMQDNPTHVPYLNSPFIFTDGTYGRLGQIAYAMCDGMSADEVFPMCSTNDALLAALCLMNHRLMKLMVAIACESKINEIISEGTGQIVKMEVDCSAIVDEKMPQVEKLAKEGKLTEALDLLLSLEKQTRSGSDMHSTSKVLVKIVQICYEVLQK